MKEMFRSRGFDLYILKRGKEEKEMHIAFVMR